jgi:hypothetical protein
MMKDVESAQNTVQFLFVFFRLKFVVWGSSWKLVTLLSKPSKVAGRLFFVFWEMQSGIKKLVIREPVENYNYVISVFYSCIVLSTSTIRCVDLVISSFIGSLA